MLRSLGIGDALEARVGNWLWLGMWTKIKKPFYNLYRRWFGTYLLDDPRPIHKSAPYTYYLPSKARQESVTVGDSVQLIFAGNPTGLKFGAERMWVDVTHVTSDFVLGNLANTPMDMPQLKLGQEIQFQPFHIIDFDTKRELPPESSQKQYWDRCFVDSCVVDGSVPVYYIYREDPDMDEPDDKYPDSGWRIRGDYRDISDEEFDAREAKYIALGKVLNADDSWIHLIDSPIGSAFMRNFETGEYEPYDRTSDDDD